MKALTNQLGTILFVCVFIFSSTSCTKEIEAVANYEVVPHPQQIVSNNNTKFRLSESTQIVYAEGNKEIQQAAEFLSEYIEQITGYKLKTTSKLGNSNIIILNTDYPSDNKESYQLTVNENSIKISGASAQGLFYGIQTLRKSIPLDANKILFPQVEITDYPEYRHRGASLDVARHFFSADFVKKYIDALALFNMNVFHWHLTDDQGWRIEIKKYPKLTEIGAYRDSTIIGRHTNTFRHERHGGYYTQEEIKEIVEYANQRHITIIPEIDIPGHTLSVLASYPELGCTRSPYHVGCEWGIYEDVLCAGNDEVFTFLNNVFDEVIPLFPSQYIHIGGDECLKNRWMACPKCQARMKELNIKDTKEHTAGEYLQSYFIGHVEKMLNDKGKRIIGWDEILEGGVAPNATIMSWRGTEGGVYAAQKGHDVIMTPEAYVYLDYYQSADVDHEPYTFGWLTELKKVYSFDPMPQNLDDNNKKHILGAQVNIWAEYMPTSDNVEYMLFPRIGALAETIWTNPKTKDYNSLVSRLYNLSKLLDKLDYQNCKQAYGIQDSLVVDTEKNVLKLYLSTFNNRPLSYSLNDSIDVENDNGQDPVIIDKETTIITRDEYKAYEQSFVFNKATAKPISLKYQPDSRYTFDGGITLVDGVMGALSSYRTGTWLGFSNTDFEAVIDLKNVEDITKVSFNCFVNTRGGLFPPENMTILTSTDGVNFKLFYNEKINIVKEHISPQVKSFSTPINNIVKAQYVKIVIKTTHPLPNWHEKKGEKAYLMLDEIEIH